MGKENETKGHIPGKINFIKNKRLGKAFYFDKNQFGAKSDTFGFSGKARRNGVE
jgi:hypothetical protein